jgi:hypothetical protein
LDVVAIVNRQIAREARKKNVSASTFFFFLKEASEMSLRSRRQEVIGCVEKPPQKVSFQQI